MAEEARPTSSEEAEEQEAPEEVDATGVPTAAEYDSYFSDPDTRRYAFGILILSFACLGLVVWDSIYALQLNEEALSGPNQTSLGEVIKDKLFTGNGFRNFFNFLFAISIPCCGCIGSYFKQLYMISLFFYVATFIGSIGLISVAVGIFDSGTLPEFDNCDPGDDCLRLYHTINALKYLGYLSAAFVANLFVRSAIVAQQKDENYEYAQNYKENQLQDAQLIRIVDHVPEEDQLTPLARVVDADEDNNDRSL
mmetsp:Transcript_11740/g.13509  ORF Transcript_11740/g.13509 Transcript_11740/m.13509 type:complete len:252 (-) Transcript_11740:286-1041(-)|eukprot:CAMPEP_0184021908 /NCGR_PEP_ID=MMETSP0954-20121128/10229_1 /TAXON_ID=627963 /ORGANISM="Aplanochytrium sp, Strain PBS07" /LENGTH=251 /DNA_ID=CAMNT_0026304059 /DNA_START=206 /DNA_END=961 /DNA_ORIENTATION=-